MLNAAKSPWLPLICNFPTTYPGLPFVWTSSQLQAVSHLPGFGAALLQIIDVSVHHWSKVLYSDAAGANFLFGAGVRARHPPTMFFS
jgi:hypothetical protein